MKALLGLVLVAGCATDVVAVRKRLRTAIEDQQDDLNGCYAKSLARDADAKGEMALVLHVASAGAVDEVKIGSSDITDKKLDKCVTDLLEQVVVNPAPDVELEVDYTFQFGGEADEPKKKKKKAKPADDAGDE